MGNFESAQYKTLNGGDGEDLFVEMMLFKDYDKVSESQFR